MNAFRCEMLLQIEKCNLILNQINCMERNFIKIWRNGKIMS